MTTGVGLVVHAARMSAADVSSGEADTAVMPLVDEIQSQKLSVFSTEVPDTASLPAVRDLRRRARLTQLEFAARLGVPVETIRNWEQGKRAPRGPARALLAVIAHSPETVFAALATEPASA